ncbi:hypothetical protein MGG_16414 [Pyricularia oryzae 70-15]|uniref:Uncharacterized protein n=1 Tax=Pyricularia oryzae (strain 70-15 / ATCC MYA-4617 / FGSC 8958) TaxID=242507 RepID=G4MN39_PYRO7|nr:uncharacterized protein MGG_16414 [Pyricularia oryzae 70-15]EHA57853.1 hypothetical protein MGG_16414 [Pyricularia oryzae 70-15]
MSASASPRRTEQFLSAGLTPLQKSLNPHIIGVNPRCGVVEMHYNFGTDK